MRGGVGFRNLLPCRLGIGYLTPGPSHLIPGGVDWIDGHLEI